MAKIFICYRRADSEATTGRIYDRLCESFGDKNVFKDVDNIPSGVDFRSFIQAEVSRCDVMLVILGQRWLRDENGQRQLDNLDDFVRAEIEMGLQGSHILLIPVLLNHTPMPLEVELPPSLQSLRYRNATKVRSDPDFHRDMDHLIKRLEEHFKNLPKHHIRRRSPKPIIAIPIILVVIALGLLIGSRFLASPPTTGALFVCPEQGNVQQIALLPISTLRQRIGVAATDGIRVYDLQPEFCDSISLLTPNSSYMESVAFNADGTTVAGVSKDGVLWLYDLDRDTNVRMQGVSGRVSQLYTVTFDPQEPLIAVGARDTTNCGEARERDGIDYGIVQLWDADTLEARGCLFLAESSGYPQTMIFNANGTRLVTGRTDGSVQLWELSFSENGQLLSSGSIATQVEETSPEISSLVFSPDETLLFSGQSDGTIKIWSAPQLEMVNLPSPEQLGHGGTVTSLAFSPDGTLFASGGLDGIIELWEYNAETPTLLTWLGTANVIQRINSIMFNPNNGREIFYGGDEGLGKFSICEVIQTEACNA